jgi:RNA polymerase sigma factor (TIGR02999 family)
MPVAVNSDTVAGLMKTFRQGNRESAGKLVELFYPQLRALAAAHMKREKQGHSWQPTLLVNELYLELVRIKALQARDGDREAEKAAFLALSAQIMRRLLIHHARPLSRKAGRESLPDLLDMRTPGPQALAEIDNLLTRLASLDSKLRMVVELRVFEGLTGEETAARMGCAPITVARYWNFAREWLSAELI